MVFRDGGNTNGSLLFNKLINKYFKNMKTKIALKNVCGIIVLMAFSACSETSLEGAWVEPIPGMENTTQGIKLERGGKASSINMATLQYETWEKKGDKLVLTGKSIGNHQTLSFRDSLMIEKLTNDKLVLKQKNGCVHNYQKQK